MKCYSIAISHRKQEQCDIESTLEISRLLAIQPSIGYLSWKQQIDFTTILSKKNVWQSLFIIESVTGQIRQENTQFQLTN